MKQTVIVLFVLVFAADGFPQERGRPQYPLGQASGCPGGGSWRNLEPDSDLLAWPIVHDIGKPNLRSGFQRITQARLCEKAGDWSTAANYYAEAQGMLAPAIPMDKQLDLLAGAARLRINAASVFYKAGNSVRTMDALRQAHSGMQLLTQYDPSNAEWCFKLFAITVLFEEKNFRTLRQGERMLRQCINTTKGPEKYRTQARKLLPQLEAHMREAWQQNSINPEDAKPAPGFPHDPPLPEPFKRLVFQAVFDTSER